MTTKTAIQVPADPRWRHVVIATVLSAVRASQSRPQTELDLAEPDLAEPDLVPFDLGDLGDISLQLDRALDDIGQLAGVTRLFIEVESEERSALITVVGEGDGIEAPAWHDHHGGFFSDPLTGSTFAWTPTAISCSFRIT